MRMSFTGTLLRSTALVVVTGTLVAWWLAEATFPLSAEQLRLLRLSVGLSLPFALLLTCGPVHFLCSAIRRVERAPAAVDPALAARAVLAGHALPAWSALIVGLVGLGQTAGVVGFMARDVAIDLAFAACAIGAATSLLCAMLAYAQSSGAVAAMFERDTAPSAALVQQGSIRGKILALGFGLNTIALLLFAACSYVRYRADLDRAYLAGAERAQAVALAGPRGRGDREAAEQVFASIGTPTVVLGADGLVRARFGEAAVSFERAAGATGSVRVADGWLVSRSLPSEAQVVSWMPEEPLWAQRRAFWASLLVTVLVVYLAGAALAWLAATAITLPFRSLGRATERIASGDLTATPPSVSRDEVGRLAADFRRMAQGLKGLLVDVQAASEGVSAGAREATAIGQRVRRGAAEQHEGVVSVQAAVEAMEGSMALVSAGVGGLSEYVSRTSRAMSEMTTTFEDVRGQGAELERAMDAAHADMEHLGVAGHDAEVTLASLENLAASATGSLAAVRASVASLEQAAGESESTAAAVADMAERAGGVVEETVHGIETLRAAVSDAHRRITVLGRRSDDIDQVVDFISEVAGRTNLLSLNASIIAAQAGEHGKAFAVVADQIRDLAAQIARSTTSIADIIRAVREDVEGTAALIDRGDALAVEGVQLARNSLEALAHIQRSTAQSRETAAGIRAAVEGHVQSSREVSRLVEAVAEGARGVSSAVQLVGRSVTGVNSVSRTVASMGDQLARALDEQAGAVRQQVDGLARLERMLGEIARAVAAHDAATRRVRDALQALSKAGGEHDAAVDGLAGVSERLGARAKALTERVGRFRV